MSQKSAQDDAQPERDPETGRFLPGNSGFGGRPKGSRNKLGEAFTLALYEDFQQHGVAAIQECREAKPDQYLKVIAGLMPKDMNLNVNDARELSDADLIARIRQLDDVVKPFLERQDATTH